MPAARRRWLAVATVVFDAQLDPREEIGAFLRDRHAREQRVAQPALDRGHAITSAASESGSNCEPNFRSSASSPRPRWVFTELREIPSVSAISSIPSSS